MSDTLYIKRGRRYREYGKEFTGFPANGIWLVEDGRQGRICQLSELPDPISLAQLERLREVATQAAFLHLTAWKKGQAGSAYDLVSAIFKAMARELAEND